MNYEKECSLAVDRAMFAAREEIRLFCRILGYPNNDLNHLIGDDPHGIVDMQEGYRYFNMTDIHVLLSDYKRWMELYDNPQTLRKVVDEWYYWSLEQKEHDGKVCNLKSWLMGWRPDGNETEAYKQQHAKDVAEAHARTEQAKQELNQEVEQFNQGRKF